MKILAVDHIYYLPASGINRVVKRIGEELVKKGHEYTVLTLHFDNSIKEVYDHGIRVIKLPCSKSPLWKWRAHLRALRFLLHNVGQYDVVNSHSYYSFWSVFAALSCKKRGVPFVFTPHYHGRRGSTPGWNPLLYDMYSLIGRLSFRWANATVCVSEFEKSLVSKATETCSTRCVVVSNGVDIVSANGTPHHSRNPASILCVSNLFEPKGVQYLIGAMPILLKERHQAVNLTIVGDGPFKPRLKAMVQKYGLADSVRFCSNLSREELNRQYQEADVFALLSSSEAYGIVVAEALGMGIPCIVAKAAALEEFVGERGCFGIDYPPDIRRLALLISELLDADVPVGPLSASKIRTWNDASKDYERVYAHVVSNSLKHPKLRSSR